MHREHTYHVIRPHLQLLAQLVQPRDSPRQLFSHQEEHRVGVVARTEWPPAQRSRGKLRRRTVGSARTYSGVTRPFAIPLCPLGESAAAAAVVGWWGDWRVRRCTWSARAASRPLTGHRVTSPSDRRVVTSTALRCAALCTADVERLLASSASRSRQDTRRPRGICDGDQSPSTRPHARTRRRRSEICTSFSAAWFS